MIMMSVNFASIIAFVYLFQRKSWLNWIETSLLSQLLFRWACSYCRVNLSLAGYIIFPYPASFATVIALTCCCCDL